MASMRVLLPAALLAALSGCAPTTKSGHGEVDDAPEQRDPGRPTVTAEEIQRTPAEPIEEVLMSRFPGVLVTRSPDGGIAVRLRGATSILGSSQPLYVIDDVPIQPGPGGSLMGINPYDIESIKVLTDPASTSMYGVRGANGVIVIKTKRPHRDSQPQVRFASPSYPGR